MIEKTQQHTESQHHNGKPKSFPWGHPYTSLISRHGQVYAGLYRVEWNDGLPNVTATRSDWAGAVDDVAEWISEPTLFTGDALPLARTKLKPVLEDKYSEPPLHRTLPNPEDVALLAATRAAAGDTDNPIALEPRYVRQSYAK